MTSLLGVVTGATKHTNDHNQSRLSVMLSVTESTRKGSETSHSIKKYVTKTKIQTLSVVANHVFLLLFFFHIIPDEDL